MRQRVGLTGHGICDTSCLYIPSRTKGDAMRFAQLFFLLPCCVVGCLEETPPLSPVAPSETPAPVFASSGEEHLRVPEVCGAWKSVTSRKTYEFRCRGNGSFDVYELGQRIGEGVQIGDSVTATVSILVTKSQDTHQTGTTQDGVKVEVYVHSEQSASRPALFRMRLNPQGDLVGTFRGTDPRENGDIRFIRVH